MLLHEPADIFLGGAAYGEAIDLDGRDANAYGHRLSIFAAGTDAFVELKVITHHGNAGQHVWSVANQGCALNRSRDLAVLNHVCLRGRESKFPIGNVDLAPAEVHSINSALDRANDVLRLILARKHVGIRHPWHGDVLVTLTAPIAGVGNAHQARGKLVTEVALQNSILDEHGF